MARGPQRGVDHRRDGPLAVGAGDMHGTKRVFRIAEALENRADVVEAELDPEMFEAEEIFERGVHKSTNTEVTELKPSSRSSRQELKRFRAVALRS